METSNYLMNFLHKVDVLISEINKLNSRVRLYQKNSITFGIPFDVRFSISPDNFIKLRDFLQEKIENGNYYDAAGNITTKDNYYSETALG